MVVVGTCTSPCRTRDGLGGGIPLLAEPLGPVEDRDGLLDAASRSRQHAVPATEVPSAVDEEEETPHTHHYEPCQQ